MLALALTIALNQPATHLALGPWSGKDLVTTTASAAKYRLLVTGKANATITLKATEVARGWLGAFCTPNVCAPAHIKVTLPQSGQAVLQFELIREEDDAPHASGATILSDDGARLDVPQAKR